MSRVQLALNVSNIDEAIAYYSKMFGVGPAKVREGYANFAIADPPLKLVLIEGHGEAGTLNHVGVELEDTQAVADKITHAQNVGLPIEVQESTTCCFAVQDKVWVKGGELAWEWYTVLADAPSDTSLTPMPIMLGVPNTGSCCGPEGCD
ncbi:MAG: glyoxalase/bleomycin resistance/dioxygenase family protein [Actinobacteria bacterium]|jgi:lactoylglutathione lyase|nr:glyoxalase/bleomycin resistance/dioxygenase family protein [Actinomycetota bacterium]